MGGDGVAQTLTTLPGGSPPAFDHEGVFEPGGVRRGGDRATLLNEPPLPLGFSMRGRPPTPALPAAMIDWPLPCPAAPVLVIRVGPPRAVGLMSRLRLAAVVALDEGRAFAVDGGTVARAGWGDRRRDGGSHFSGGWRSAAWRGRQSRGERGGWLGGRGGAC